MVLSDSSYLIEPDLVKLGIPEAIIRTFVDDQLIWHQSVIITLIYVITRTVRSIGH